MGVCVSTRKDKNPNKIRNINKGSLESKRSKTVFQTEEKEDISIASNKGTVENEMSINDNILSSVNPNIKDDNNENDIINVKFISSDQVIDYSINCSKSQYFYEIEAKLYEKYPKYRDTNNYFLVDGKNILRFKTIEQNGIKDGIPLTLIKYDKDYFNTNNPL